MNHFGIIAAVALLAGCATPPPGPLVAGPDQRPAEFAPKRVSSTTMAVWLAAWEDDKGDLHAPATVYVEPAVIIRSEKETL